MKVQYYAQGAPCNKCTVLLWKKVCVKLLLIYIDPFTEVIYTVWTYVLTGVISPPFITFMLCTTALKI